MEVNVERTAPCVAKISLRVSPEEFTSAYQRGLRHAGRHMKVKGFRAGKIPPSVVEKQHGSSVRHETAQGFLQDAWEQAVRDESLEPTGQPRIRHDALHVGAGEGMDVSFEVSLRPEIELGDYEGIEVESKPVEVADEEVEATLEDLRRQRARPEPAGDGGLPEEGMALTRIEYVVDGEVVLERDGVRLSPASPAPGTDAEAFRQAILGATDGTTVEVAAELGDDFPEERARGREGTCRVHVQQAYRIVPPTQEEVRVLFEVEDDDALDAKVREQIREAKARHEESRIEGELLNRVLELHPAELPEPLVAEQVESRLGTLVRELAAQGTSEEEAAAQAEGERASIRNSVERSLRALFVIEAIAKAEDLQVSQEDVRSELQSIARRNDASVEEVARYYQENELFQQLGIELLERKVRRFLRESAEISPSA